MCRLSLAWVTSENSTRNSNADILKLNLLRWTLSCLPLVSGVQCWLPLSVVPRQLSAARLSAVQRQLLSSGSPVNCLSAGLRRQLSFTSPYHFRIRRDFMSKNPLSGFAPKQTKESSALAALPHSATNGPGDQGFNPRSSNTKDSKNGSRVKWNNPGNEVAPFLYTSV